MLCPSGLFITWWMCVCVCVVCVCAHVCECVCESVHESVHACMCMYVCLRVHTQEWLETHWVSRQTSEAVPVCYPPHPHCMVCASSSHQVTFQSHTQHSMGWWREIKKERKKNPKHIILHFKQPLSWSNYTHNFSRLYRGMVVGRNV